MIRQGWLVVFTFLLFSCGNKKDSNSVTRWDSFPVAIYADSAITSNNESLNDFQAAMNFWESRAGKKLFNFRGTWNGTIPYSGSPDRPDIIFANIIFFHNSWPFAENIAGKTVLLSTSKSIKSSMIMVNPNIGLCTGDCHSFSNMASERNIFAHELGHFLGLNHAQSQNNIMYSTLITAESLDHVQIDQEALRALTE